jgi:hypothetical protein
MKKLELNQMETIQGGESAEEYCKTMKMIINHNNNTMSQGALAAAAVAMAKYC